MPRSFLLLQGVASPLFKQLAARLSSEGQSVYRLNFCGGDVAYAGNAQNYKYQKQPEELHSYIQYIYQKHHITDIILFGDTRYVNQTAINLAKARDILIHVFEEGYLRPHWVTLERQGVNANSLLPKNIQWYRSFARTLPKIPPPKDTGYSLSVRAMHDIRYRLANGYRRWQFPYYSSHRPFNGVREYSSWAKRFPQRPRFNKKANRLAEWLRRQKIPFFLFPLQLNSDAQVKIHSPFNGGVQESITRVLESFAINANDNNHLIIKSHPLDTGIVNHYKFTKKQAISLGIDNQVHFIDGGNLEHLLGIAKGTVLINSTTGMQALLQNCPVHVMGNAIYDMPSLTSQSSLDSFWKYPEMPNPELFSDFRRSLIYLTQINGDLYTRKGIEMTVEGAVKRLEITKSHSEPSLRYALSYV